MPSSASWNSVTYGNGKFVAVVSSSNKAAISTDGITWTETALTNALVNPSNTDITSSVYSALEPYIPAPTVPTKTSELTNDSGYITQTDGDGRYLQLSGGTVTGKVKVDDTVTVENLTVTSETQLRGFGSSGGLISMYGTNAKGAKRLEIWPTKYNIVDDENTMIIEGLADIPSSPYINYGTRAANKNYVDQYAPHATLVTLTTAGWNSTAKTQTVTVSGILADESKQLIIPMPAAAFMTAYNDAGIQCTGQAANSLTFTAETVPTAAISVYVTYQAVIS